MLHRSAVILGYREAFREWLETMGLTAGVVAERERAVGRTVYLIPPCQDSDELEEVVADIFAEILRRELTVWRLEESAWPDTGDVDLFSRWFTVEGFTMV